MMQNLSFHVEHPQEANPIKQLHSQFTEPLYEKKQHSSHRYIQINENIYFLLCDVYYSCVQKFYPSYSAAARPQIR